MKERVPTLQAVAESAPLGEFTHALHDFLDGFYAAPSLINWKPNLPN